jgi:hypothetical protein
VLSAALFIFHPQLNDKNSIQREGQFQVIASERSFQARSPPPFFISFLRNKDKEYNGKIKINVSSLSEITFSVLGAYCCVPQSNSLFLSFLCASLVRAQ